MRSAFITAIKPFPDTRLFLNGNSRAAIPNFDASAARKARTADGDGPTGLGVFERIIEQIGEDLAQSNFIRFDN